MLAHRAVPGADPGPPRPFPYYTEQVVHAFVREIEIRGRSPQTIISYLAAFRFLPSRWPRTAEDVQPAIDAMDHLSALKRYHHMMDWRILARFSRDIWGIAGPLLQVRLPRKPATVIKVPDDSAIQAMFDACRDLRDLALVSLIVDTGIRWGEVPRLRSQVFRDHIVTSEGKRGARTVPISDATWEVLERTGDQTFLWLTTRRYRGGVGHAKSTTLLRECQPLSDAGLRNMWRRIEARAGVRVNPHSLRHKFATVLLDEDVDLSTIQQFMGHKSIASTVIYTHVSQTRLHRVLAEHSPLRRFNNGLVKAEGATP